MIALVHIKHASKQVFTGINRMVLLYPLLAGFLLQDYLDYGSLNFILGMLAIVLGSQLINSGKRSNRFGWVALVMISLCCLMPVKTLLFFTICLCAVFFVESFIGKINPLVPVSMFLMSPVFQYLVTTFSFPIRLSLSQLAGKLFKMAGVETTVSGNVIVMGGNEYSVDAACMGLQMLEASLLLGVLLMLLFQKQYGKKLHIGYAGLFLLMITLLNIVCNLIRIVILVRFNIPADTIAHELVGILCLLVYVFLPAIWIGRRIVKRFVAYEKQNFETSPASARIIPHLIFIAAILMLGYRVNSVDTHVSVPPGAKEKLSGYILSEFAPGIWKLKGEQSLIYIKYTRGFFDTDHSPLLCWTGSGYVFQKVEEKKIGDLSVYTGILEKGDDRLYTAWWFDNGVSQTIDPIAWRWDNMKGANKYAVVNVTCSSPDKLINEINKLMMSKELRPLLIHSKNKSEK